MAFIMDFVERNMVGKAMRQLFIWLDFVIYNLISFSLQVIFDIAGFNSDGKALDVVFNGLLTRIYLILSIFMFFKVLISLLAYLVNPDAMSDKQKGAGKLVSRVVVTLIMLIAQPMVFSYLYRLQGPILETLPRVILGVSGEATYDNKTGTVSFNGSNAIANEGTRIAWNVLNAFYRNNEDCGDFIKDENGNLTEMTPDFSIDKTTNDVPADVFTRAQRHINDACTTNSDYFKFQYTPFVSSLAGGFLCYTLIGIAIQVGMRLFKLMILQLIAPIPIISYIDPTAGKDSAFSKWVKMVLKTWLELFINIGIVYIIIYIITSFVLNDASPFATYLDTIKSQPLGIARAGFFIVFIILGLFTFARKAPQFIMDALGIKSDGGFRQMLALSAAAVGSVGSAVASTRAGFMADKANGRTAWLPHNVLKNVGAGLLGGAAGFAVGANAAVDAKDRNSHAAMEAMAKRNSATLKRGAQGGSWLGATGEGFKRTFTGMTTGEELEAKWKEEEAAIKYEEDLNSARNAAIGRAKEKALESTKTSTNIDDYKGASGRTYNIAGANAAKFNSVLAAAEAGNGVSSKVMYRATDGTEISATDYGNLSAADQAQYTAVQSQFMTYTTDDGTSYEIDMRDARLLQYEINEGNIADYYQRGIADTTGKFDNVIAEANARYKSVDKDGNGLEVTLKAAKTASGASNRNTSDRKLKLANEKQSKRAKRAQANSTRNNN